jgi:hypothetical protein
MSTINTPHSFKPKSMKTLKLFNAVVAKPSKEPKPFIAEEGFIIEPNAMWARKDIMDYYARETLNGNDLNKTFHKSWKKIKDSPRCELLIHQILHYITTYGTGFQAEMYIPQEVLEIPDLKLTYKVILAYTKEEMTEKCLDLLKSGIALAEETVDDLITVLVDELDYTFTGKEGIRNKEAIVKIAEMYNVYPDNPTEFFRFVLYRTTNTTLLIKNDALIDLIKNSSFNPATQFKKFGYKRLAEIFNRFKPLFLAYKKRCPRAINKISKLSKTYHKPMVTNALNEATQRLLIAEDKHWLDNATPFALFKALSACYSRKKGQDAFVYRIRSGKSWVQESKVVKSINKDNYQFIMDQLRMRFPLEGVKIFLPKDVEYALPTSEKMFVGNIPTGTKFSGKKMAVGIYWENDWGARDLDLSGMNVAGKIGWNATYQQGNADLLFSGDITNAPDGAVEYLYANKGLAEPTLVMNNVYFGDEKSGYKIIVGKGDKISKDYMMDPNNLFAEVRTESVQKQTVLGIFLPTDKALDMNGQSFVLLNFGAGHVHVSGNSPVAATATKALFQQWSKPLTFKKVLFKLGADLVDFPEEADHDFSLDKLEKDSFTKLFSKNS